MKNKIRGYISSRQFMGERVPQHVQNLVIRNYCSQRNLEFLLSATEYAMSNCSIILNQIINELPELDGIAAYSLFQLPENNNKRNEIYKSVLAAKKEIHFCVEGLKLQCEADMERIENIWLVRKTIPYCLNPAVENF
jgi:sporadic carbohydrate cluster protein (TIGR04323 family)